MAYKIAIDAGHGGEDPGAVYQGRKEKDDTLRLALAVGEILENNGVEVVYTRTEDVYQTPFQKAQIANAEEVDYFVSIHRNSSPEPNQYSGVETLVYDKSGEKVEMAENINGALGEVGFAELGVKERPGLVVLRRTKMPAILVEAGFLNTDKDNQLFDESFADIAQGIAEGIMGTIEKASVEEQKYYRVQTGAFKERPNGERMLQQLLESGYPAFLLQEEGYFKVQVGAYQQLNNAVTMERRLRKQGYATMITV